MYTNRTKAHDLWDEVPTRECSSSSLRIVSYNVSAVNEGEWGMPPEVKAKPFVAPSRVQMLRYSERWKILRDLLLSTDADIICLQESTLVGPRFPDLLDPDNFDSTLEGQRLSAHASSSVAEAEGDDTDNARKPEEDEEDRKNTRKPAGPSYNGRVYHRCRHPAVTHAGYTLLYSRLPILHEIAVSPDGGGKTYAFPIVWVQRNRVEPEAKGSRCEESAVAAGRMTTLDIAVCPVHLKPFGSSHDQRRKQLENVQRGFKEMNEYITSHRQRTEKGRHPENGERDQQQHHPGDEADKQPRHNSLWNLIAGDMNMTVKEGLDQGSTGFYDCYTEWCRQHGVCQLDETKQDDEKDFGGPEQQHLKHTKYTFDVVTNMYFPQKPGDTRPRVFRGRYDRVYFRSFPLPAERVSDHVPAQGFGSSGSDDRSKQKDKNKPNRQCPATSSAGSSSVLPQRRQEGTPPQQVLPIPPSDDPCCPPRLRYFGLMGKKTVNGKFLSDHYGICLDIAL